MKQGVQEEEKNLGSRVALLPGNFFPVRKVFQKVHKKCKLLKKKKKKKFKIKLK